jgi:hypothetical protein
MSSDNPEKWYEKTNLSYYDEIKGQVKGKRYIYTTLLKGTNKENALNIIKEAHATWGAEMAKQYCQKIPPLTNYKEFKKAMKDGFESMRKNHITFSIKEDSDEKLEFNVTHCIFAEACKELDSAALGYAIYCHGDYEYAKTLHPRGRMVRSKTLMQGDPCCDHTYVWEDV